MSDYFKKTKYSPREQETAWLNITVASHDMFCFCDQPWNHLLQGVLQRGSTFELDKKTIRLMQKCLISTKENGGDQEPTTETNTAKDDGDFDLDEGELEKLFEDIENTG